MICRSSHVHSESCVDDIRSKSCPFVRCQGQLHRLAIETDANSMPKSRLVLVKSKNAENSTESSSSPVESSTALDEQQPAVPMMMPVAGSDCGGDVKAPPPVANAMLSQQQSREGWNMEIQNSTGNTDSFERCRDLDLCILKELCSDFRLSRCEIEALFSHSTFDNSVARNSSLTNKSRSLIDVDDDEGDNKDDENPPNRETLPSVNVNSDSGSNDEQHDDDDKNNDGAREDGGAQSMQNSSLTSKDYFTRSTDKQQQQAMMMMMMKESSKEFHHNDDEVDSEPSLSTPGSSLYQLWRNTRYLRMIDESTAHFTPSSSCSCPSSNIKEPSPSSSTAFVTRAGAAAAHRVKFNPSCCFVERTGESKTNNDPPQMEPMSIVDMEIDSSIDRREAVCSAKKLSRPPIRCPLTNCDSCSMPSEFCNHITIDHPSVGISKCAPGRVTNMTINHLGDSVTCQRMFLVSDKIADIGAGMFENCLPIVLLTLRGGARSCLHDARERYLHIWLAGVYEFPCDYTLTVWIHGRDESEPTLIKCLSNTVLNMNSSFNPDCVVRCSLTLSPIEVEQLSWRSGSISCQVVFH